MQRRQKCTCDIKFFIKKMANHDFFYIFISRFHIPVLYVKLNVATSEYLAVKRDDKGIPAIYYSKTITVFYIVRAARRGSCVHALFLSHLRVVCFFSDPHEIDAVCWRLLAPKVDMKSTWGAARWNDSSDI